MELTRSEMLNVRLRRSEAEGLRAAARLSGKSTSDFVRDIVLDAAARRLTRHANGTAARRAGSSA